MHNFMIKQIVVNTKRNSVAPSFFLCFGER